MFLRNYWSAGLTLPLPSALLQRRMPRSASVTERSIPTVTLSAGGGFEASQLLALVRLAKSLLVHRPSLSQTLFNGGLYRAQLQQYTAIYNADVATYRQTVLTAFQQVEDYLAATRILSQQILKQQEAVDAATEQLDLEMGRYQDGN